MAKTIAVIGAMDTKGSDFAFIKSEIERRGHKAFIIDTGVLGEPLIQPNITSEHVAQAGGIPLAELQKRKDKSLAMETMTRGIAVVMKKLHELRVIDAGFSMGGSNGTMIGTSGLRVLPIGIPKVMVSTVASGDTNPYVGISDIVMFPSILDVSGVNRFSAQIYANAVGALIGMVETGVPQIKRKPLITASMFGNTTVLVNQCKEIIEQKMDYEVLVFHATGTGGMTMESLIENRYISGVLEVTTTELADELLGGVLTAGPNRMDAAAKWGVPQVIAPGCLDMVNFWGMDSVPDQYKDRLLYAWNPNVTLMRTTPEENVQLGRILAEKANASKGAVAVFLPLRGISELDASGEIFWDPEADLALFNSIKQHIRPDIPVYELDCNINDEQFAQAVSSKLLELLDE
ncbi:Tm-1-like ATP-binding domain-containing protein [Thermoflavimicrobium daqui]|jgi:uncharacterized protein (UPF0261 family)|uniref:Uncharacterized protein n=1 Tax=Thermoflavimicrobium daqui TaxID=2137476 RepID=A0A364K106_9BACL|nr:Tm-1-like ATP-binding domain-containing protein [Thermoflavimicrobium daqui]RAL21378.1 hypothetical protein DL897_16700 [Thermoflavimicrobium daqui]